MLQTPPLSDSPTVKQRKPRKPRGRGLRTTTGCAICRKRHMKCDEVKPVCGPCGKGNRPCYYGAVTKPTSNSTSDGELNNYGDSDSHQPERRHGHGGGHLPRHMNDDISRVTSTWDPTIVASPSPVDTILQRTSKDGLGSPVSTALPWLSGFEDPQTNVASPQSTLSFNSDAAPLRWFGLLADDAEIESGSINGSPLDGSDVSIAPYPTPQLSYSNLHFNFTQPQVPMPTPRSTVPNEDEKEPWRSPAILLEHEVPLFQHFVKDCAQRLDLFDPLKHFSSYVPQLAMNNEGLLKAILALSARQISLTPNSHFAPVDRTASVQYYYETLQYLQRAMKFESFTKSSDILAISLILSAYEMTDGAGKAWERHLKGVFWIQRSQDNHGESGGLKQAVWWAWLRQDIWAAFRERRKCFSPWRPSRPYHMMDQFDIACRALYLLAQSVNYSSDEERSGGEQTLHSRVQRGDYIMSLLEGWKNHTTIHFKPLPVETRERAAPIQPMWINPPIFAAAMQMHYFSKILLLIHRPAPGGFLEYLNREKQLLDAVDSIIAIAMTVTEDSALIVSTQCLFAAGLYAQDLEKRAMIAELLEDHIRRTSWPVSGLIEELRAEWSKSPVT